MHLLADFGNTRFKVAWYDGHQLSDIAAYRYTKKNLMSFTETFKKHHMKSFCYLTVKALPDFLQDFISHLENVRVFHFPYDFRLPFTVHYKTPHTLGADRLAGIVGGMELFPENDLFIIQMGTCITYDLYLQKKGYIGGLITPGVMMRNRAMHRFTSRLPQVDVFQSMPELIGTSTEMSLRSGILNGTLFEVEGVIHHVMQMYPLVKVLLTGGDAQIFVDKIKYPIFAEPFLTIEGLKAMLKAII